MSLKRDRRKNEGAGGGGKKTQKTEAKTATMCLQISMHLSKYLILILIMRRVPGPKYKLKTLVGYRDHCISKYRNPAYTFGGRRPILDVEDTPGPKYMIDKRKLIGFTFGHALKHGDITFGPGPKYKLPDVSRGPFFSIKWRTKLRKTDETPGPYYIKPIARVPAFSMGLRTVTTKPVISAGPYPSCNLDVVKSRTPTYTIVGARRSLRMMSEGADVLYAIRPPKPTPAFSFGVKHSECAPPYIIECDKQC
ncbi:outer dense fiber protein 3-like [Nylanderia fulva]|uniref:outer dense fiber protein 3-like n=1 Tax=Nylanderia fulva TaxID=613905 RepID=UPI0010FB897C|nr:outer dense fiber protein 3-like [Nylanderia fulva]